MASAGTRHIGRLDIAAQTMVLAGVGAYYGKMWVYIMHPNGQPVVAYIPLYMS